MVLAGDRVQELVEVADEMGACYAKLLEPVQTEPLFLPAAYAVCRPIVHFLSR